MNARFCAEPPFAGRMAASHSPCLQSAPAASLTQPTSQKAQLRRSILQPHKTCNSVHKDQCSKAAHEAHLSHLTCCAQASPVQSCLPKLACKQACPHVTSLQDPGLLGVVPHQMSGVPQSSSPLVPTWRHASWHADNQQHAAARKTHKTPLHSVGQKY